MSGLDARSRSLVLSVGQLVIERAPPAAEDWAIGLFGRRDKAALIGAVVVAALALGAIIGLGARRSTWIAVPFFSAAGAAGAWAALVGDGDAPVPTMLAATGAVGAGLLSLHLQLHRPDPVPVGTAAADPRRRQFLGLAGGIVGVGVVAGGAGRLVARLAGGPAPRSMTLTAPTKALAESPRPAVSFDSITGLTAFFTPNRDFYRIDTALALPRVDLDRWRLGIRGMVEEPFELSYAELSALPQAEADIALSCVSNEIGGPLVGNARWQGVPLGDLLGRAGVKAGATQVVGRSVDGWTGGFPTAVALDGRPALVALGMNGEPLPLAHGFPARLVVSGLYGYVSATKWLSDIELTTIEAFDGYWVPRGWSKSGVVRLQSRIDVPRSNQSVPAESRPIAGVAWGPGTGIEAVEVSVDDGPWAPAILAPAASANTWRQWRYDWQPAPGKHRIAVRATDGFGQVQPAETRRPRPDGATGYHTVTVTVR